MDLAAPPQSGADTGQLVGVIVGALVAALSLVLIVILAIFLILLLTRRRSQKLYDVPVPPQPQNMDNPVYTGRCRCSSSTPSLHIIKYMCRDSSFFCSLCYGCVELMMKMTFLLPACFSLNIMSPLNIHHAVYWLVLAISRRCL